MDQAMHDQFAWQLLLLLAALKLVATSLSFVSGTPGGLFAPTLFMGAMLGGAVGGMQQHFFPVLHVVSVGPYALVGMGVLFAGILRAPMTSIFMIVELTGDYSVIVPVMIANAIAYLISRRNQTVSLFDALSRQDGMSLPSMEERREEKPLRIEDAMRDYAAPVLAASDTVRAAREAVHGTHESTLLVRGEFGWGSLPATAVQPGGAKPGEDATIGSLCAQAGLPTLHPDEPLETALRMLEDRPLLPVVRRSDHGVLLGVLGLQEILQAYRRSEEESETWLT
jgi:CIC family chloride channel protein